MVALASICKKATFRRQSLLQSNLGSSGDRSLCLLKSSTDQVLEGHGIVDAPISRKIFHFLNPYNYLTPKIQKLICKTLGFCKQNYA